MKISCIAVDDEPPALALLQEYVQRTDYLDLKAAFNNPVAALEQINLDPPDLVFLDVNMPDLSGMDLSRRLPERTKVIFTTAYESYALESYRVAAIDYLLKPFSYPEFLSAADKAHDYFQLLRGNQPHNGFIFVKAEYKLHKLLFEEILFVENVKDYVRFHLSDGRRLMSLMSLKSLEKALPAQFMKVHRSYIVNLNALGSVERGQINIQGHLIPVATRFRTAFQEYLSAHGPGP